jgi:hypothetical protein
VCKEVPFNEAELASVVCLSIKVRQKKSFPTTKRVRHRKDRWNALDKHQIKHFFPAWGNARPARVAGSKRDRAFGLRFGHFPAELWRGLWPSSGTGPALPRQGGQFFPDWCWPKKRLLA